MLSHRPAKFSGHRHCGSADIMVLVCHVISQDLVIEGSCDFVSHDPPKWGGQGHCSSVEIMVLNYHVILQDRRVE